MRGGGGGGGGFVVKDDDADEVGLVVLAMEVAMMRRLCPSFFSFRASSSVSSNPNSCFNLSVKLKGFSLFLTSVDFLLTRSDELLK